MARSSIKPNAPQGDTEPVEETQLATQTDTSVGDHYADSYDPGTYDDVGRDIEVPVLGLINNVGPLAKAFKNKAGNFVLGETLFLGETVQVIPTSIVKVFREKIRGGKVLKYGTPEAKTAKVWPSARDAQQDGYIVGFKGDTAPNQCEEAGAIGYLVIAPEGSDAAEFSISAGSLTLAQAKCSYQRGGYRAVWRRIFDHAAKLAQAKRIPTRGLNHSELFLKAQPWTHAWTLSSTVIDGSENSWYEPRISRGEALPADVVEYITTNYGK